MNQKDPSDSVIPGPGSAPQGRLSHRPFHLRGTFPAVRFNHSGVTFLTRNPTTGSAKPVVRYWIPVPQEYFLRGAPQECLSHRPFHLRGAFAGMTWLSIVFNMTDY